MRRRSLDTAVKYESVSGGLHPSEIRSGEVSGDQQPIAFRRFVQQFAPGGLRLRAILAEGAVQAGLGDLDGVMNDVAQKDAGIFATPGADRNVARSVARRGKDRE